MLTVKHFKSQKAISVRFLPFLIQGMLFLKVNFMKYAEICEELEIDSEINKINRNFRKYIEQVFSPIFLKKIDRVFKKPLIVENFKENTNVMALTSPDNVISVNTKMFLSLPTERAMVYIIHELFHVLQNMSQFPEVKKVNKLLGIKTLKRIPRQKVNEFLTGKSQDIHSDYKDEFLSYCSNAAFKWDMAKELKAEYLNILKLSGIFNLDSEWWSKRF